MLKTNLLLVLLLLGSICLFAQPQMINPSNRQYAHMGESVAQYSNYSILGAYEDYGNTPYTGSAALYQNGQLVYHYKFDSPMYSYMTLGRDVDINNNWVAASAPGFTIPNNGGSGAVFLAKKVNNQYQSTMNYRIDLKEGRPNERGAISLYNDYLVAGAASDGVKGEFSGAAMIYKYNSSLDKWEFKQKIYASDPSENAYFGYSVAMHGSDLIIGAPGHNGETGKVYWFRKSGETWTEAGNRTYVPVGQSVDVYYGSRYGHAVDVSYGTAIIGAPGKDYGDQIPLTEFIAYENSEIVSKRVFHNLGGQSVSIYFTRAVVGEEYERGGRVNLLFRENNEWKNYGSYVPCTVDDADYYGHAIDIYGSTVVAGVKGYDKANVASVTNEGGAYLFNFNDVDTPPLDNASLVTIPANAANPSQFLAPEDLTRNTFFGSKVQLDDHDDLMIVSDPEYKTLRKDYECRIGWGGLYVYHKDLATGTWKFKNMILPGNGSSVEPKFGNNFHYVGNFEKGHTLAVTAEREGHFSTPSAGAVYVYRKTSYFNDFTFHSKFYSNNPQNLGALGFGSGGVVTNGSHVIVSTLGTKELSLHKVEAQSTDFKASVSMGIEGVIQGMTTDNIVVVSQGAVIKFYKVNETTSTITEVLIPDIKPVNSAYKFTGKVSVSENGLLFVQQANGGSQYVEALKFFHLSGTSVLTSKDYYLPFSLSLASTPVIKNISLNIYKGFAVALNNYRVVYFSGNPDNYVLFDIYQASSGLQSISNAYTFGNGLELGQKEIIVGDPLNNALHNGTATYSCHQCNNSGGYGLVSILPINEVPTYDGVATTHHKPFSSDLYSSKYGYGISTNGKYAFVSSPGSNNIAKGAGSVMAYTITGNGTLSPTRSLYDPYFDTENARFGTTMDAGNFFTAISEPGHPSGGRVFVFDNTNISDPTISTTIYNPVKDRYTYFGISLASWNNYVAIGSINSDTVYVYQYDGARWTNIQNIRIPTNPDSSAFFGYSMDMGNGYLFIGDVQARLNGNSATGAVHIYKVSNGQFVYQKSFGPSATQSSSPNFGSSVVVSGSYAAVTSVSDGKGKVTIYKLINGNWTFYDTVVIDEAAATGLSANIGFNGSKLLVKPYGTTKVLLYELQSGDYVKTGQLEVGSGDVSFGIHSYGFLIGVSPSGYANAGKLYEAYPGSFSPVTSNARIAMSSSDEIFSIEEETKEVSTVLYPNPCAEETVSIKLDKTIKSVKAVSGIGEVVFLSVRNQTVDISSLSPGMYTILIETEDDVQTQHFVKL